MYSEPFSKKIIHLNIPYFIRVFPIFLLILCLKKINNLLKILFRWSLCLVFKDTRGAVVSFITEESRAGVEALVRWVLHARFLQVPFVGARLPGHVLAHGREEVVDAPGDDGVVVPGNVGGYDNDGEANP